MQLRELYRLDMHYTDDTLVAEPGTNGPGGQFWGELEGRVTGDRIHGSYRASNRARLRMDGTSMPDIHGLIRTDDGAEIYLTQRGYSLPDPPGQRTIVGGGLHQTAAPRYAWLNRVWVAFEGAVIADAYAPGQPLLRLRVFECLPELDDL